MTGPLPLRDGELVGAYRILSYLGGGQLGIVHLAEEVRGGHRVALKVLGPELSKDPAVGRRFMREMRIAVSLRHPNIVPVEAAGDAGGRLFIAMRYVEGPDLGRVIREAPRLPVARTVGIIQQVADGLDAAHASGCIHRDLKPANILVETDRATGVDRVFLADFGLSTRIALDEERLTLPDQLLGTVAYVSPEQIEGRPIDRRADVYALGCTTYECLAGSPPYPRASGVATLLAHLRDRPPSLTQMGTDRAIEIDAVIAIAMAVDPDRRYATAGAFARALRAAAGLPREPHRPGPGPDA